MSIPRVTARTADARLLSEEKRGLPTSLLWTSDELGFDVGCCLFLTFFSFNFAATQNYYLSLVKINSMLIRVHQLITCSSTDQSYQMFHLPYRRSGVPLLAHV
jgi:hypothetical protein